MRWGNISGKLRSDFHNFTTITIKKLQVGLPIIDWFYSYHAPENRKSRKLGEFGRWHASKKSLCLMSVTSFSESTSVEKCTLPLASISPLDSCLDTESWWPESWFTRACRPISPVLHANRAKLWEAVICTGCGHLETEKSFRKILIKFQAIFLCSS